MQQEIWFSKYRILQLLGSGSTSKVYLAEHVKLKSLRAIKCISKKHPFYQSQLNEAHLLRNLKHSCIPIIYDIEEDDNCSYIIEQYINGLTLDAYIAGRNHRKESIIIQFGMQLCELLQELHGGKRPLLYLDLKPNNIIVTEQGLKLVDFGSAVYKDEVKENQPYFGTKGFAAPELFKRKIIDERCEIYGIGAVMFYMVTGKVFDIKNSQVSHIDFMSNCSKDLKNVISRCLHYRPFHRYRTISEVKKQLSAISNPKNPKKYKSNQPIKCAIAGAQGRIGVTHFSLLLSSYLTNKGRNCLYHNINNSDCSWAMKNRSEQVRSNNGIYQVNGIPMLLNEKEEEQQNLDRYQYIIWDMGVLQEENQRRFLEADIKVLILGSKEWELSYSEQVLEQIAENKDIIYLFNFLDGRQFRQVLKSMDGQKCFRIPFVPNPYLKKRDSNLELFHKLARSCGF